MRILTSMLVTMRGFLGVWFSNVNGPNLDVLKI